jgi:hypothetical protein
MNDCTKKSNFYQFNEGGSAAVTFAKHRFGHLILKVGPPPDLVIPFDLFTSKRNVRLRLTESTALFAAIWVQAPVESMKNKTYVYLFETVI